MVQVQKIREYLGHTQAIYTLAESLRQGYFLSAGSEGLVVEWDIEGGVGKPLVKTESPIYSMLVLKERGVLALGLRSGEIAFVDLVKGGMIRRVNLHRGAIFDLLPLQDGHSMLASGEDGALSIWNLDRFDHLHYQKISPKSIRTIDLNARNGLIALGDSNHEIHLLDAGLQTRHRWKAHGSSVFRVLWGADGHTLYSTGRDALIKSWAIGEGSEPLGHVAAHLGAVNDLVKGPGNWMFSASMDKSIKLWQPDLTLRKVVDHTKFGCHWNGVNRILWHEGSLFSCSDDRKIFRWQFDLPGSATP